MSESEGIWGPQEQWFPCLLVPVSLPDMQNEIYLWVDIHTGAFHWMKEEALNKNMKEEYPWWYNLIYSFTLRMTELILLTDGQKREFRFKPCNPCAAFSFDWFRYFRFRVSDCITIQAIASDVYILDLKLHNMWQIFGLLWDT